MGNQQANLREKSFDAISNSPESNKRDISSYYKVYYRIFESYVVQT